MPARGAAVLRASPHRGQMARVRIERGGGMDGGTSFFGELLGSIAERGRALLDLGRERRPTGEAPHRQRRRIVRAVALRQVKPPASHWRRKSSPTYAGLRSGERIAFFETLAQDFAPTARLDKALAAYARPSRRAQRAEIHFGQASRAGRN